MAGLVRIACEFACLRCVKMVWILSLASLVSGGCGWLRNDPNPPSSQWTGSDHVQYFPNGPEFKLNREDAERKAARGKAKLAKQDGVSASDDL